MKSERSESADVPSGKVDRVVSYRVTVAKLCRAILQLATEGRVDESLLDELAKAANMRAKL